MHVGMHMTQYLVFDVDKGSRDYYCKRTRTHAHTHTHKTNSSKCPSSEVDSTSNAGAYSQLVTSHFLS